MTKLTGLTTQEAAQRRAQGYGNDVTSGTNRTIWNIVRTNLFSTYNNVLFVIGIVLAVLGRYNDAFITVIVGIVNAIIRTYQEIQAKRKLEQIAIVASTKVTVMRDGVEQEILPTEIVQDDLIRLQSGDQAIVDGRIVSDDTLEIDEALLTGESDLIHKSKGDEVLSGSFCVTGSALYSAEKVGADSYAAKLTAEAQDFNLLSTPLQDNVSYVINLLILLAVLMAGLFYLAGAIQNYSFLENVEATAVLVGLVPYGLFLTIEIAYLMGATAISEKGALVQQTNAVESLNSVNVLCMDKTGTLTANELVLNSVDHLQPIEGIDGMLGDFVCSVSSSNTTNQAIADGIGIGRKRVPTDEVPFSSARKWSALAFDSAEVQETYVLGAIEMLAPYLPDGAVEALDAQVSALSERGLRVLLFAASQIETPLAAADADPSDDAEDAPLPLLYPLALVSLRDKLRPQVAETLSEFQKLGIRLKIISGDNPETVAALAKQAGLRDVTLISGPELAQLSESEVAQVADETVVFGRISPEQKQQLVTALIDNGNYVAMIGDGVNDVLSLKKAQLGIAMQSGSNATRNVADMVLLNDSYAALPAALSEGKRIRRAITDATYLLIGRALTYALIIIGVMMVGISFPFEPAQVGLTTFSVGIPAFCLILWARPNEPHEPLLSSMVRLIIPYAIWTMILGVLIYALTYASVSTDISAEQFPPRAVERLERFTGVTYDLSTDDFEIVVATIISQTTLTAFLTLAAIFFLFFLAPPIPFFTGWRTVSSDRRPTWLAIGLTIAFFIGINNRQVADYFGMLVLPRPSYAVLAIGMSVWILGFRYMLRKHLSNRLLP